MGQERAVDALRFGVGIRREGYNLFAAGRQGVGKHTLLSSFLEARAKQDKAPPDYCYVHDFAHVETPRVIALPTGRGARLSADMTQCVTELRVALRAAFDSEEYRTCKQRIMDQFSEQQAAALIEIRQRAVKRDVAVLHSNTGISIAPIHGGEALDPEAFRKLPEAEQNKLRAAMDEVAEELQVLLRRFHDWGHEQQEALATLARQMASAAVQRVIDRLRKGYADVPALGPYLDELERDAVESADQFLEPGGEGLEASLRRALTREHGNGSFLRRYEVNLIVQHAPEESAPVVYEDNPTHANLLGRIEHETQFGTLTTNFTLIKAGAFHRALGGYLLLDALKVLQRPLAWEAVKRAVRSREIRIEPLSEALGLVSTVSLRPEPVPLGETKVVLMGERVLYYLLSSIDPEFPELFKVLVDFEETMERRPEAHAEYAKLVATLIASKGLRAFERAAVAAVIDHAARAASDAEKLSLNLRGLVDLLQEADYWAGAKQRPLVGPDDVQAAIDAQLARSGRVPEQLREAVARGDIQIATEGAAIGQANGLSVYQLGELSFGHATRITGRARMGKGEVVDIEREVKQGGPLHSKGVLILTGFLSGFYATGCPLSLSATLVFEQTYGGVEGDSASLAELCVLLSAIAEVPLKQGIALTGSVDQLGHVQAIGGVNEKIEGFFDVCKERGLSGDQGVILPRSNAKNLMVRRDVTEAIAAGRFHLYTVEDVADALELLTGQAPGSRDSEGNFPQGSLNGRVEARLIAFAERARATARPAD